MVATRLDLRENVPVNIVKGAKLENTINELFNNFETGEQRNAELVNKFFDQTYFKGEASLIGKLAEVEPNIKFDDIKEEKINLAILLYNNGIWDLKNCIDKITNDEIKKAIIQTIHDKVHTEIGATHPPYNDFDTECPIPGDTNVLGYFQKVTNYLEGKEGSGGAKKTIKILEKINITNEDINNKLLATESGIPAGVNLTDPTIPNDIKNAFDTLLSFEIGKEADRTINISKDISKKLQGLLTNTFPAINTIIGECDEYKYNEENLGDEYKSRLETLNNDTTITKKEKDKQIKALKWEYYLKYLKTKNAKLGNTLEQLYENNFDYSKIDSATLKEYLDTMSDIRLKMLFDNGLNEAIKINFGNYDDFKDFYKKLADPDETTIKLKNVNIPGAIPPAPLTGAMDIPVQKKIKEGPNEWLKDIDEFGKDAEKSYDALPIEYIINKDDFDRNVLQKITLEDKEKILRLFSKYDQGDKYEIKGEEIGILIYLFSIINSKTPIERIDPEKQKEIENLFGKAKSSKHKPLVDTNDETEDEKSESNNEDTPEKFKEEIEKLGPGKFENGSEIWLPVGESELPGGGYQWMKIKISNINMNKGTFKGSFFGGELKFGSNFEGKSRTFKMNQKTLNELKTKSKDGNKVWLQPNPEKSDFNSFKNSLKNKLGTSDLLFPVAGVTWNENKFMQKTVDQDGKEKDVEVKYFGASSDDKSTYKVEYNPIRKSFTVSSTFNGDEKGKDGKTEKKRFYYKRDMDWNNFLIFFTQKGLVPQTEEEATDAVNRQDQEFKMVNGGKRKLNRFSINNIKNVFKTIKGNIKKKIDDYDKAQDQKLEDILIGDRGLYGGLANILGFIPSIKGGLGELQQEYYNERDNRTWKKIEYYLKIYQADPDFGTTFDQIPPHAKTQGGKSLQMIITDRVKNATDRMGDPGLYQAAALLLANFEKGGSPYRGLSDKENTGLWVKALLGKAHYNQFMRDKAKLIKARDDAEAGGSGDKKGLNETLSVCEWKYIVNNIRGSYKGLVVGSYEERGIPGEENTNYIDNPAKRLLSDQFASKLESAYQGRFTKDSVKDKYSKFTRNNSFDEIENEFGKSGSSRYQIGEAAIRRMIDLASNDDLERRMKRHFLTYLLSGALDVNCDPGLKKQVYGWAKPIMFVPGLLVKDANVAENIAILLDNATNGDFSRNVKKYFRRDKQLNGGPDLKGLQKEINAWLTDEKMNQLDKYFSDLPTKDFSGHPHQAILEKYQKAMSDSNRDESDRGILDNPKVVSNGLLSSVEVVQRRMNIKNGAFNGKDIDENKNMEAFRTKVTKDINNRTTEPREVAFVLEKFFNRFGLDNQKIYERIRTADYWDKNRGQFSLPYKGVELNMGNIGDKEIESILWYAFQGNARKSHGLGCDTLPDQLLGTLKAFQSYFEKAFHDGTLLNDYVVKKAFQPKHTDTSALLIGSRDVYDETFAGDSEFSWMDSSVNDDDLSSGDTDKARKAKKNKRKELLKSADFINSDIANIEKQLKRNLGGTSRQFKPVTSSNSRTLREQYLRGRLTA